MADRPLFTNEAALAGAKAVALSICDPDAVPPTVAKVRLFDQTLIPDSGTKRDDLIAAETTLTGYPAGGYSVTDFFDPQFLGGGAVSTSPIVNVAYASGAAVQIGGYWIEDATAPTPQVREVFVYDPARNLAAVGDGWQIVVQLGYGANAAV